MKALKKHIVSMLLVLVTLLTILPTSAFAATSTGAGITHLQRSAERYIAGFFFFDEKQCHQQHGNGTFFNSFIFRVLPKKPRKKADVV